MFPYQFIILLVLVALPGEMELVSGPGHLPNPHLPLPNWLLFASFFVTQFLLVAFVWNKTRSALRALHEPASSSSAITQRTDWLFWNARWAAIAITGVHLFCTPLGQMVVTWNNETRFIRLLPILPETFFILPALCAWFGIWTATYYVEEATHERSLPYRLGRHAPVHPMPPLGSFLGMQARHNFFPYLLILVSGIFERVGHIFSWWYAGAPEVSSVIGAVALVTLLPFMLVRVWETTPLTGPLRERLDRVTAKYRLRFRNILLWRTHHLVINAAILGWVPFGRYFLMSDSLLETFSDRQLEAVFAHEVGHGARWHIPWFGAILLSALAFSMGAGDLGARLHVPGISADTMGVGFSGLALLVFGVGAFYVVAPRFEHQADWFAARHMGRMIEEDPARHPLHSPETVPVVVLPEVGNAGLDEAAHAVSIAAYTAGEYPHAGGLAGTLAGAERARAVAGALAGGDEVMPLRLPQTALQAGSEVFISALETLVENSHRDRKQRDFMHPSVEDRVKLLRDLAVNSEAEKKFEGSIRKTKLMIFGMLVAGIAAAGVAMAVDVMMPLPEAAATQTMPATQTAPASQSAPATQTMPAAAGSGPA